MNWLRRFLHKMPAHKFFLLFALSSLMVVGSVMAGLGIYMERQLAGVLGASIASSFSALANEVRRTFDPDQPLKSKASLQNYAFTHPEIRAITIADESNRVLIATDPRIKVLSTDMLRPLRHDYRFAFDQQGIYRDIRYFNSRTLRYDTVRLAFLFDSTYLTRLQRNIYLAPLLGEAALILILLVGYLLIQRLWVRPVSELADAIQAKQFPLREDYPLQEVHLLAHALNAFHAAQDALVKEVYDKSVTDALTGLHNRSGILQALETRLGMARRHSELEVAVVYIDLDGFKEVNDTFGHEMGDWVLHHVARVLKEFVRQEDALGRLGGDEFLLVALYPAQDRNVALTRLLQRLLEALELRLTLPGGHVAQLSASIGVAIFPENGEDANALLTAADLAMYAAKKQGRGRYHFFDPAMAEEMERTQLISRHLGRGLEDGDFYLVYQPKVDVREGRVKGFEALARYRHPILGEISPLEFIPLVNRSVEAPRFARFIAETAIAFLASIGGAQKQVGISINIQRAHLDSDFLDYILSLCKAHNVAPTQITFELLEADFFADMSEADIFKRLAALGIRVAIDDFGTGYSSLSYLDKLDVDELKVDRSFVTALEAGDTQPHVLKAISEMSHALEIDSVVEGVETAQQVSRLHALGFDVFQGYYFARPMRAEEAADWMAQADVLNTRLQAILRSTSQSSA